MCFYVGQLAAVDDLSRTSTTITWDPPFSLDLTDIDPDIVYCVEVYNITCGRRDLFISDCNVTEPSYTSDALYEGLLYHITVTPRSNVSNALSGNSLSITGIICILFKDYITVLNLCMNRRTLCKVKSTTRTLLCSER